MQTIDAVARQIDNETGLLQALFQVIAGFGFVFHHKNFLCHIISPWIF